MSIQTLKTFHQQIAAVEDSGPHAWLIVANPVWGRCESENVIAIFDTKELAEAYVAASRLPEPIVTAEDKIRRTFRPDSSNRMGGTGPDGGVGFSQHCQKNVAFTNGITILSALSLNPPRSGLES